MVRYYKNDNIGIIEFNDPDVKVNLLSHANIDALKHIIDRIIENDGSIKALFFISAKKNTFIAGADIKELAAIRTKEEALQMCRKGQDLFNKIESLARPTFAVVDGACIGGGLELALSCNYILATKNKKVKLGLPEKKLGITPGFGGSRRLAKKIGARKADYLIDTGMLIDSKEAKRLNMVDRIISESEQFFYQKLIKICRYHRRKPRKFILAESKTNAELDKSEGEVLAEKILREPAINSLSSFLLVSKYRNYPWLEDINEKTLPIEYCAVIGAGTMGKGIAYLLSSGLDLQVGLREINKHALKKARLDIRNMYRDAIKRNILYKNEAMSKLRNISFGNARLSGKDLVIESATEDISAKKAIFAGLEQELSKDCILSTNTSCLSVEGLAKSLKHAERFLGTHFFNPAYKMKLVEVVPTKFTSCAVLQTVIEFLQRLKRIPIIVKDSPGFLVNRMILPYLNEAIFMLEDGFSAEEIEATMLEFGMPMGPLGLLREIGLDVAYKASKILEYNFGSRMRVSERLKDVNSVQGLALNKGGSRLSLEQNILERLLHPIRREAGLCLEERVVANREIIDLALLLGIGFPSSKRIWKN